MERATAIPPESPISTVTRPVVSWSPLLGPERGPVNQGSSFWGSEVPLGVHFLYLKSSENWQWLVVFINMPGQARPNGRCPEFWLRSQTLAFWVEELDPQRNFRTSKRGTLDNCAHLWLGPPRSLIKARIRFNRVCCDQAYTVYGLEVR